MCTNTRTHARTQVAKVEFPKINRVTSNNNNSNSKVHSTYRLQYSILFYTTLYAQFDMLYIKIWLWAWVNTNRIHIRYAFNNSQ